MTQTKTFEIQKTSAAGVTINYIFVPWRTLSAAAKQENADLAKAYAEILAAALAKDAARITSEDWKQYGYPLRTGFGRQYAGQAVMRAWETRRIQKSGKDVRVAYIVTWDRSMPTGKSISRVASPELATHEEALTWVAEKYGPWHDELGGERTASVWMVS